MKPSLLILSLLALSPSLAFGAVGTEASPFLKIDSGARASAMGGAFTAIADDASGIFYNPAGPALMRKAEIFLSHNQWIEELNAEQISYVHPVSDKLTYFAGFSALLSPMMPSYDLDGNRTGTFNSLDSMYGGGVSLIEKNIIAGCFVKMITQEAYNEKGSAYAGDVGLMSTHGNFRFGAAAQNLGGKMKIYKEEFDLPRIYRGGAAYRALDKYWLSGEVQRLGEADVSYALGAEGEFNLATSASAFIRFGYNSGRSKNAGPGITAGLGLSLLKFSLDYAFSPFGDLGDTHRISLAIRFGKEREPAAITSPSRSNYTPPEIAPAEVTEAPEPAREEEIVPPPPSIAGTYETFLENAQEDLENNELSSAFAWYGKASESIPPEDKRQTHILERQGLILVKQNNCTRAKKFYSAAVKTAKKNNLRGKDVANAYSGLAYCQEKSGNSEWAASNYRAAITATDDAALKAKLQKRLAALKKR